MAKTRKYGKPRHLRKSRKPRHLRKSSRKNINRRVGRRTKRWGTCTVGSPCTTYTGASGNCIRCGGDNKLWCDPG